jgi:DNA-binding NarL/FixJ family response regulator
MPKRRLRQPSKEVSPSKVAVAADESPAPPLGVLLIDAPAIVRAGIASLVSAQPDMEVLIEASFADEAVEATRHLRRRKNVIAVIGLGLDGERDSFWLIRAIRERLPSMPILGSASHADDAIISKALFAGADGFVDKDAKPEDFLNAIRRSAAGEVVLAGVPEDWLGKIVEGVETPPASQSILTPRELEVLEVAAQGLTARQIGNRLGVRERTVTTHLSRIYKKLGAGSRVAALARAAQSGLVTVGRR